MDELAAFQQSAAYAKLQVVVERYEEDATASVRSTAEAILKICEDHGYAYERVFQVRYR